MASSWGEIMAAQMGWPALDDGWRKGPWTTEEDKLLIDYVKEHVEGRWNSVARLTGLRRNGKSCRLRWVNYLRPDLKRGQITPQEEVIILELHARWGNRWSTIARSLPGRTDNEIKNYWRTHFKKKAKTSNDNAEKLRAHLLRKQQFQQQLLQQQQEEQHEINQFDVKKFMSMLEENNGQVVQATNYMPTQMETTINANTATIMYPNTMDGYQDQGLFYSLPNSDTSYSEGSSDQQPQDVLWDTSYSEGSSDQQPQDVLWDTSYSEGSSDQQPQDVLWDELWGLEDVQGSFNAICAANNQADFMHQFVTPFY